MIIDFLAAVIIGAGAAIGISIGMAVVLFVISLCFSWSTR